VEVVCLLLLKCTESGRKVNVGQRRYAVCSALAASAVPSLVLSRGHKIDNIAEVPLVIADSHVEQLKKTKDAVALLKSIRAYDDVEKSISTRRIRAGKGKARNRKYLQNRGPLIVHTTSLTGSGLIKAFRNIPGIELANVYSLDLLQLAPGGHLGRFIVWTESAFRALNDIFGTPKRDSKLKTNFRPPHAVISNSDLHRIINSDEIQSAIRPKNPVRKFTTLRKNPLTNFGTMVKLNPYAVARKRKNLIAEQKAKDSTKKKTRKGSKPGKTFKQILKTPATAPVRGPEEYPPEY
jgi:large subunit ribosomal protein L4e